MAFDHKSYALFCEIGKGTPFFSENDKESICHLLVACIAHKEEEYSELSQFLENNYNLLIIFHNTRHLKNVQLSDVFSRIQQKDYQNNMQQFLLDICMLHDLSRVYLIFKRIDSFEIMRKHGRLTAFQENLKICYAIAKKLGITWPEPIAGKGLFSDKISKILPAEQQLQLLVKEYFPHSSFKLSK